MKFTGFNWLYKHLKKIRSTPASLWINSCAESSKTQTFPENIVNKNEPGSKMEKPTHAFRDISPVLQRM